jgi:hypothetical protein
MEPGFEGGLPAKMAPDRRRVKVHLTAPECFFHEGAGVQGDGGTRNRPTLASLCDAVPNARVPDDSAALRVARVRDDSRLVEPGDVFVGVPGARTDGADHVGEAERRGAAAVVLETDRPAGVPVVRVSDARTALALLAAADAGYPARDLTLVGITGTVGKTSVLGLLAAILDGAGIDAGMIGSLGVRVRGRPSRDTALTRRPDHSRCTAPSPTCGRPVSASQRWRSRATRWCSSAYTDSPSTSASSRT